MKAKLLHSTLSHLFFKKKSRANSEHSQLMISFFFFFLLLLLFRCLCGTPKWWHHFALTPPQPLFVRPWIKERERGLMMVMVMVMMMVMWSCCVPVFRREPLIALPYLAKPFVFVFVKIQTDESHQPSTGCFLGMIDEVFIPNRATNVLRKKLDVSTWCVMWCDGDDDDDGWSFHPCLTTALYQLKFSSSCKRPVSFSDKSLDALVLEVPPGGPWTVLI